jgi:quinol-cytochrome oxidoreductase complex cytochrome b subunit
MLVNQTESSKPVTRSGMKRIVGLIAVALILVFTILAILRFLSPVEWIVAEIIVALIANIIFRMIDKRGNK